MRGLQGPLMPNRANPSAAAPAIALLGHGDYAAMVTAAGAGWSRWKGLAITRWREDVTRDCWGNWFYLRDLRSGDVWSPCAQPSGSDPDDIQLDEHAARFARRDNALTTTLEVAVDPDSALEVRGIGLRNDGDTPREIEITSYAELVLGSAQGDASHPAFSKMFVQTHRVDGVLLATRRKRDPSEPEVWAAHSVVVDGEAIGEPQYETDRERFIGRDRDLRSPLALDAGGSLSGTVGTVLDPVFSLRVRVRVAPRSTRRIAFVTAVAAKRRDVLAAVARCDEPEACERVFVRAAAASRKRLRESGIDLGRARIFLRLASAMLYSDRCLRAPPEILTQGEGGAPVLWAKGISGDLPIALLRVSDAAQLRLVEDLLSAQKYWRARQMPADVVILNEATGGAAADLQQRVETLAAKAADGNPPEKSQGSAFVLRGDQIDDRLRVGLLAFARVILDGKNGDLEKQVADSSPRDLRKSSLRHRRGFASHGSRDDGQRRRLRAFNGFGGFGEDGREYVIALREGQSTPMPWSHLVANPDFGFLATASSGGYCWATNSQQNSITPWSNDAVRDPPSEVLYLRDVDNGAFWSATASPIRVPAADYITSFGPGYAKYECVVDGIESELLQFVAISDRVKISRLRLRNRSRHRRRLSVTGYVQWALAAIGTHAAPFIVTSFDTQSGALLARNRWREEFAERVAFAAFREPPGSHSGDRGEFLSTHGALSDPAALRNGRPLSGHTGAGLDPCAALQTSIELEADAETELVFLLGEGKDEAEALQWVQKYRTADIDAAFARVQEQWKGILAAVQVRTPDANLDRLLNGWLLYQVLACRLWARTAFYQASGAFGFRDQLQDVMALCVARPDLAREHILLAASRQFVEGDVQHWWLPPNGRGIRSRVTDDRLWLPFVTSHFMETTGDHSILEEEVPFVEGEALKPGQNESFFAPQVSQQTASLFEHCARAIEISMKNGAHGLPLMGSGDWNDGMNRVGIEGKGESVWLGWFLHSVLQAFAPVAEARGETQRAQAWRTYAEDLRAALDKAWDGEWYRRAYYDDGAPLGSQRDTECRIDSLAQSWSVISGAGDPQRAERAMQSVDEHLVREKDGLVALFTAPFDRTKRDPGYIKGYPPGLRENGGQYTHGSIWSLMAFALLGDGDKAHRLFRIFDPQNHSMNAEGVRRYKVEPYVVCADVYSVKPHVGRGGWTWYSGSAGWLYRAGLEYLLGFRLRGDKLRIDPCIPKAWSGFEIEYRHRSAHYAIAVENPDHVCRGVMRIELDGSVLKDSMAMIPLADDGAEHRVRVVLGKTKETS
ncbi:MAG TPA: glycosyl transferase family 36 [Rhodanobacteraceae bacterium]